MKMTKRSAFERGHATGVIWTIQIQGFEVEMQTAVCYLAMAVAAKRDNIELSITSGFRDNDEQRRIFFERMNQPGDTPDIVMAKARRRAIHGIAAKPGFSKHQNGTAIDIGVKLSAADFALGRSTPEWEWVKTYAPGYGFAVLAVTSEPWHLERVMTPSLIPHGL